MEIESLTTFLGWCTVINFGILILASLFIAGARGWVIGIHSWMFGVSESELSGMYLQYLGNYKIATLVLNLAPYCALKAMS